MNPHAPILRLLIVTQTFVLFAVVFLPALIHYLHQPLGKFLYAILSTVCIVLALFLRRALSQLER